MNTELTGATACVSIYQASQTTYDLFDKVLLEGRQIFFGKTTEAKQYFLDMGFDCPDRQTVSQVVIPLDLLSHFAVSQTLV
jgi:ATP-binding cassette subfamily G (WHITE) protein 2 (PDR)